MNERDIVESFAREHNLLFEPYFKETAAMSLEFRHPSGGQALIIINPVDGGFDLHPSWARTDYESESVQVRKLSSARAVPGPDLTRALRAALHGLLDLTPSDLDPPTPVTGHLKPFVTKERFEATELRLPVPRR